MKVLIVYASKEGQTAKIARRIGDIAAETADVALYEATSVPNNALGNADAVIVAAPVHFDNHPRRIARFVRNNLAWLRARRSAFISVSGSSITESGRGQAEEYVTDFLDDTRWMPDRVELVAGGMAFTKYNWLIRFIMRRIAKAKKLSTDTSRDYEYTNWEQIDRFAREFIAAVAKTKVA